jgi:uncharacterized protein Yka (UPF0111/DUF47 family)
MAAKSVLSQVQSLGEEALGKLAQNPTATRLLHSAVELRDRVDDLGKRVRGLEDMDNRLTAVEKRLDELEKASRKSVSASKTSSAKKSASDPSAAKP